MNYDLKIDFDKNLTTFEHISLGSDYKWYNNLLPNELYGVREILNPENCIQGGFSGWACRTKSINNLNRERNITPLWEEKIENIEDNFFSSGYVKYNSFPVSKIIGKVFENKNHDGKFVKPIYESFRLKNISINFISGLGSFYNESNTLNYPFEVSIDYVLYSKNDKKAIITQNTTELSRIGLDGLKQYDYTLIYDNPLTYTQFLNLEELILFIKPTDNYSDLPIYIPIGNIEIKINFDCDFEDDIKPDDPKHYDLKIKFENYYTGEELDSSNYYARISNLEKPYKLSNKEVYIRNVLPGKYIPYELYDSLDNKIKIISNGYLIIPDDIGKNKDTTTHEITCYFDDKNVNKVIISDNNYFKCNKDNKGNIFNDYYFNKDTKKIALNVSDNQVLINTKLSKENIININKCE